MIKNFFLRTQRRLKGPGNELDGLIKMKFKNQLGDDEFTTRKDKLNNEIAVAKISLSESQIKDFDLESCDKPCFKFYC